MLCLGGICLSSCLIITISLQCDNFTNHETYATSTIPPYLKIIPSSIKESVIFVSKTDRNQWLGCHKGPQIYQDRIEGQVLARCNANGSLYSCKNVYIAASVSRESGEKWTNVGQICYILEFDNSIININVKKPGLNHFWQQDANLFQGKQFGFTFALVSEQLVVKMPQPNLNIFGRVSSLVQKVTDELQN